jgi:2-keto-4-pentenoate hydratase/2-oxohepta-3-ene-1,7-dioic acid hydratase in catechol pathway
MKLLTFHGNKASNLGIKVENTIIDLPESYYRMYNEEPPKYLHDMRSFLEKGDVSLLTASNILNSQHHVIRKFEEIRFAPLIRPRKILCVAVNYGEHAKEAGGASVEEPYVFTKFPDNVVAHNANLLLPRASKQLDHELELAIIIGKEGKYIKEKDAFKHIAGYSVFNDVSFRDRRKHSSQRYITNWLHGKNMDFSAPVGPYLVTADEIQNPQNLRMTLKVNGEIRQDGNTKDMIHKIPEILEYISDGITLYPGDIISTGTVTGSGLGTGKFLKAGDRIEATIENIGTLINTVEEE